MEFVIDVAFVLGAVSFFKMRLGLSGWSPLFLAFVLAVLVSFLPELTAALPGSQAVVEKVVRVVQLFLTAPGLFDLAREFKK